MNGKLVFTEYEQKQLAMLFQDGRLLAVSVLPENRNRIGAIYNGKVKNITPNIDACFVEISDREMCFLSLKEAEAPYLLNRRYDGRLREGDELPVQLVREAQKGKLASVTARISMSNDFFALTVDTTTHVGFSGKFSKEQKQQLEELLTEKGILENRHFPQHPDLSLVIGGVVRTRAAEAEAEELAAAFHTLYREFTELLSSALHKTCFTCLKEAPMAYQAILDTLVYPHEFEEIITDREELYRELDAYCREKLPGKPVRFYKDTSYPLQKLYSLQTRLGEALGKKVWLKSGGYLIIEPTEALTAIDVNSGRFEGSKNLSGKASTQNAYKVNLEAVEEIALQLRLRNLSGMILVDFINMGSRDLENALLERMRQLVKKDKTKTLVVDITPLGLMEITRKKTSKPLWEQLSES